MSPGRRQEGIVRRGRQDGLEGQVESGDRGEAAQEGQRVRALHVRGCGQEGPADLAVLVLRPVDDRQTAQGMPHENGRLRAAGDGLVQGLHPVHLVREVPVGHLHAPGVPQAPLPQALPVAGARILVAGDDQDGGHGSPWVGSMERPRPSGFKPSVLPGRAPGRPPAGARSR